MQNQVQFLQTVSIWSSLLQKWKGDSCRLNHSTSFLSLSEKTTQTLLNHFSITSQTLHKHFSITSQSHLKHFSITSQTFLNHFSITSQTLLNHISNTSQSLLNHFSTVNFSQSQTFKCSSYQKFFLQCVCYWYNLL